MKPTAKLYLKTNVFDAAKERLRWLFSEFPNVNVSFSGGKDSTVILNLALGVAEELGRLPLPVAFVDQEAEWDMTIDYVRKVMADPRITPYWYQIPFRLFNATSKQEEWLHCWDPKKEAEWVRPKEPNSIHRSPFRKTPDRFHKMFEAHIAHTFKEPVVDLIGIRTQESMNRFTECTGFATYKGETWGGRDVRKGRAFSMYPIYDWAASDVWKAIHENGWDYCGVYDLMYQYGIPIRKMRVSSITHENAANNLTFLQEFEADTWNRLCRRMPGLNSVKHLELAMTTCPRELPPMFSGWKEYRDYLLQKLILPEHQADYRKKFAAGEEKYVDKIHYSLFRMQINCILTGDRFGSKLNQWETCHVTHKRKQKGETHEQYTDRRAKEVAAATASHPNRLRKHPRRYSSSPRSTA